MTAAMPSQFIPPIDKLLWPVSLLIKYGPYYLGKCGLRGRWNREGVSGLVIKSWILHTFSIQSWEKTNPMECQWKTQFETNKNKQTVNILLIRFSRRSCSNVVSLKVTYILFAFEMFFFRGCSDVIELSFGMLWAYSCPTNSQILTDLFIFSKGSLVNLPYPLAIMQRAYTQIMLCHLVPSSSSQLGHDPSGGRGDGWNKCWNSGMSLCHV